MLTVHSSNRLERLADALAAEIKNRPQFPLIPEVVVVQSLGARRWLSFALAERLGVAMNLEFPFPAALVEKAFHVLVPRSPVSPLLRRDVLPWRIHALLPELWDAPGFEDLRRYGTGDPVKLWQLAGQIAGVFDRYLAYRPKLLRAWDAGEDDADHPWQSRLWREIAPGRNHPAALAERAAAAPEALNSGLPARISVFGLSTLAPFHLELLGELGRRVDTHLYVLAPTQEYWGDLRGEKEERRYRRWREQRGRAAEIPGAGEAHPLLASLGKIGREFHEAVLDLTPANEPAQFVVPEGESLLRSLQRGILQLTVPEPGQQPVIGAEDQSILVHNCHTPLRELEVLHDQLLALFDRDHSLEPRDVLVSVPDVASYAPFIDAVFGAPESESLRFPYSIADRDARSLNRVTDAILRVLDLAGSRYAASEVFAILECPPVFARFELRADDLPLARRWIAESGARWALDGEHRERLGFPKWEENTWQFGLDRLLLGFALPSTGADLFEGIFPEGDIEGSLAETLGRVAKFCATLFRIVESFAHGARAPKEWAELLAGALDELCASDGDFADAWNEAAQTIEAMAENAELAGNAAPVPFGVIREHLSTALAALDRGNDFLRGGVTFCSLKPMRAVPHRVIALLGLNDTAFPRSARPPSFDLTASHPKPGDRTARDDDRYLFLENILSARDVLHLSYCGQSAKDDSESPPSVVVVELLDFIASAYQGGKPLREQLTICHPLQPWDRGYFQRGSRLSSYSREAAQAARVAASTRQGSPAFITSAPLDVAADRDLSIDQLAGFFAHPAKFFAQEVLGMRLPFEEAALEDVEPMDLDGREAYGLRQELADAALRGDDPLQFLAITRAKGTLPHGSGGEITFAGAAREAALLAERVATFAPGAEVPNRPASAQIGEWHLRGHLCEQRGDRLTRVRAATIQGKDLIRAWCHHLFACAAEPGASLHTLIVGRKSVQRLQPLEDAAEELHKLLELYALGHTRPLPFFPASSLAYADALRPPKPKSRDEAIAQARKQWSAGQHSGSEGEDGWNQLIWRPPAEPFSAEWERLAVQVFEPLLAHLVIDAK